MPQASPELCAKFPGDDAEALDVLEANFIVASNGIIYPKDTTYTPTGREVDAIDYLFGEWDYCYDPNGTEEKYGK